MNRKAFILFFLFILSRFAFINPLPVFFDSPEYLRRFSDPNYIQAIASGHLPFHAGYMILFWPVYHLASLINFNPSYSVILMQIFFSAIALFCFYRLVILITNKRIAAIAASIFALTPLYWVMNVTTMVETTYINLFIISLFLLASFAKRKNCSYSYLGMGCISFGLALLTNPLVFLWTPLIFFMVIFFKKEKIRLILPSTALTIFIVIATNAYLIAYSSHTPLQNGVFRYLFGVDIVILPNASSFLTILRFVRNTFFSVLQSNTAILAILSVITLIKIIKKNTNLFIMTLLWILPAIFTSQWYDPLLFGRHGAISGFGFALLSAIFLEKRKILLPVVISYLVLVSLPALLLLKQPIPYLEVSKFAETLPKGLLIETHFARPQVEGHYSGEIIFVNQPGWSKIKLKEAIDGYLTAKKPVLITSQALSDPYGIYSGPFLYSLSLSYLKKFELEDLITSYSTKKYAVIDKNAGIIVYKIVSKGKSQFPKIPILKYSRHRMDFFDPATQLWFLIERASITQSQNIISG